MTEPIEPEFKLVMNVLAANLDEVLNGKAAMTPESENGFVLLTFPFSQINGRVNYISNAQRKDVITAMKEIIARMEGRVQETDTMQ